MSTETGIPTSGKPSERLVLADTPGLHRLIASPSPPGADASRSRCREAPVQCPLLDAERRLGNSTRLFTFCRGKEPVHTTQPTTSECGDEPSHAAEEQTGPLSVARVTAVGGDAPGSLANDTLAIHAIHAATAIKALMLSVCFTLSPGTSVRQSSLSVLDW